MNLSKSYDFFKPEDCQGRVHIIGCGAVGSTIAENLARLGLTRITLYDFDVVEEKNIANQMFTTEDLNMPKVESVKRMICRINPAAEGDVILEKEGWTGQRLSGYIFLAVDNIEIRQQIVKENRYNQFVKGVFDFRMRLEDGQHYAADWTNQKHIDALLKSMDFTHEEAAAETPVSACNQVLSVAPTVRVLVGLGVANFMNFIKGRPLRKTILVDAFNFTLLEFV